MEQATAILLERLGAVSLADLAERFSALYPKDR
jgi:hypothetical protein